MLLICYSSMYAAWHVLFWSSSSLWRSMTLSFDLWNFENWHIGYFCLGKKIYTSFCISARFSSFWHRSPYTTDGWTRRLIRHVQKSLVIILIIHTQTVIARRRRSFQEHKSLSLFCYLCFSWPTWPQYTNISDIDNWVNHTTL